jgi:hypothetical protein
VIASPAEGAGNRAIALVSRESSGKGNDPEQRRSRSRLRVARQRLGATPAEPGVGAAVAKGYPCARGTARQTARRSLRGSSSSRFRLFSASHAGRSASSPRLRARSVAGRGRASFAPAEDSRGQNAAGSEVGRCLRRSGHSRSSGLGRTLAVRPSASGSDRCPGPASGHARRSLRSSWGRCSEPCRRAPCLRRRSRPE